MPSSEPKAVEITSISRVASIPLVNGAVDVVLSRINQYPITRSGYATAKGIPTSLYNLTEPFQTHLAPVITYADGYANKGIDLAQAQFPAAFETKPEDVTSYVKGTTDNMQRLVREQQASTQKLIDDNVISPAYAVAEGIDKVCLSAMSHPPVVLIRLITEMLLPCRCFPGRCRQDLRRRQAC
jgi:hypothetical protein